MPSRPTPCRSPRSAGLSCNCPCASEKCSSCTTSPTCRSSRYRPTAACRPERSRTGSRPADADWNVNSPHVRGPAMDDEALRSEFAALLAPVQQIPIPDSLGLRRRAHRRRAGQASASALACACVAIAFTLLFAKSPAPRGSVGTPIPAGCASRDLVATWLPPAKVYGHWAEAPPETLLLVVRNTGQAVCSLEGWPRFFFTASSKLVLRPGAAAVSTVSVELPIAVQHGCATRAWLVRPPAPGAVTSPSRGDLPEVCDGSFITVSPLYPPSVPITQDYQGPFDIYPTSSPIPTGLTATATMRANK